MIIADNFFIMDNNEKKAIIFYGVPFTSPKKARQSFCPFDDFH